MIPLVDVSTATEFDVGELLRGIVLSDQEMASYVGSRMYPNALPDATSYEPESPDLPAIFYSYVTATRNDAGVVWPRWQLTCTANTQAELQKVCGALLRALNRYKGGRIRYVSVESVSIEYDNETKKPYAPITVKVEFF